MTGASDPLSAEAVAAVDSSDIFGDMLDLHAQVVDALRRAESAGLPQLDAARGLVVCGMGGSAIGADLAAAILGERATRPLRTVRDYTLPPDVGPDTLVLGASYSGNTEETLAAFAAAGEAGAPRVALATHGRLAELAREAGVPVIGAPSGFQPRAAVAYMTVGALACAAAAGAGPSLAGEVEAGAALLERLAGEWGPGSPADSLAKEIALALHGQTPVIYGAGATAPVATRWKTQVNENAERHAFASVLPEADHNEVCAWGRPDGFAAVFLEAGEPDRIARRFEVTREAVEAAGAPALVVEAQGSSPFERVMSLVLLGDLVSGYLAVRDGIDPTPVHALEGLKRELSDS